MTTQAIVSIVKNGHTFIKAICGCDGYNAEKLAKIIQDHRLDKIQDIYDVAIINKFGCKDCLVVMNSDGIIFKGDDILNPLYRSTFDNPSFNPRWECGIADNVVILKIDEPVNSSIEELKNWVYDVDVTIVDDVLEFLYDHKMLNESGEKLKHEFWEKYIKSDKMTKIKECILGTNGMVMSFDDNDEQIPECQGFILDIADKLKDNCDENTKWIFGGPGKGMLDANLNWYWRKNEQDQKT